MTSESRTFASPQRVLVYEKLGSKRREWIHMSRKSSPDVLSDFNSTVMRETTPSLQSGRLRGDTSTRVSVEHHRESRGTQETEFICDKNGDSASQSQRVPEMDTTQTNSATSEDSQVPLRREEDKSSTATDASDKLLAYCSGRRDIEKSSVINSSSARTSPRKESVVFQDSPACARGYRSKHIVRQSSSDRRAAVLLTILVGFFLLSYLPWVIISIYEAIRPDHALPFTIYTVAVWLQYVNSLINPFLYVYQDLEFRHAVVAVLTKPSILFVRLTL
ncbi:muscarinic acetylcholine receptor gar-3-like [Ptychodera flava]